MKQVTVRKEWDWFFPISKTKTSWYPVSKGLRNCFKSELVMAFRGLKLWGMGHSDKSMLAHSNPKTWTILPHPPASQRCQKDPYVTSRSWGRCLSQSWGSLLPSAHGHLHLGRTDVHNTPWAYLSSRPPPYPHPATLHSPGQMAQNVPVKKFTFPGKQRHLSPNARRGLRSGTSTAKNYSLWCQYFYFWS